MQTNSFGEIMDRTDLSRGSSLAGPFVCPVFSRNHRNRVSAVTVRATIPFSRDVARLSEPLASLPPYVFAELDRLKTDARRRGVELTDLGIGSPDRPTPPGVIDALQRAAGNPTTHGYPP